MKFILKLFFDFETDCQTAKLNKYKTFCSKTFNAYCHSMQIIIITIFNVLDKMLKTWCCIIIGVTKIPFTVLFSLYQRRMYHQLHLQWTFPNKWIKPHTGPITSIVVFDVNLLKPFDSSIDPRFIWITLTRISNLYIFFIVDK